MSLTCHTCHSQVTPTYYTCHSSCPPVIHVTHRSHPPIIHVTVHAHLSYMSLTVHAHLSYMSLTVHAHLSYMSLSSCPPVIHVTHSSRPPVIHVTHRSHPPVIHAHVGWRGTVITWEGTHAALKHILRCLYEVSIKSAVHGRIEDCCKQLHRVSCNYMPNNCYFIIIGVLRRRNDQEDYGIHILYHYTTMGAIVGIS